MYHWQSPTQNGKVRQRSWQLSVRLYSWIDILMKMNVNEPPHDGSRARLCMGFLAPVLMRSSRWDGKHSYDSRCNISHEHINYSVLTFTDGLTQRRGEPRARLLHDLTPPPWHDVTRKTDPPTQLFFFSLFYIMYVII